MRADKKKQRNLNPKKKLTHKQKLFTQEYIKTGNATQSALKVYNCKSKESASATGSEVLSNPIVKSEIARLADKIGLTDEYILNIVKKNINDPRVLRLATDLKGHTGKVTAVQVNVDTNAFAEYRQRNPAKWEEFDE